MKLSDFFNRIESDLAKDAGSHTLHPGLAEEDLHAWYVEHPGEQLPEDLLTLLRWSNGFGLYQEYYDGEPIHNDGAYRFYPLAEITRADLAMYNAESNDEPFLPQTRRAFIQGLDSNVFYGYDTETLHFWQFAPTESEADEDLGPDIGLLLEHLF